MAGPTEKDAAYVDHTRIPSRLMASEQESFWPWFGKFLRVELTPYPGRTMLVARVVTAATITMIFIMIFRMPGGPNAAFFTLLLPRDNPGATLKGAGKAILFYSLAATWVILGALFFVNYPLTHLLWVVTTILLCFFVMRVVADGMIRAPFAFGVLTSVPIWDATSPTDMLVVATLWNCLGVAVGLAAAIGTEYAFSLFYHANLLHDAVTERLNVVGRFLYECSLGQPSVSVGEELMQLALVGVARLRGLASGPTSSGTDQSRLVGSVSLVGRLVELCAEELTTLRSSDNLKLDKRSMGHLAAQVDSISDFLQSGQQLPSVPLAVPEEHIDLSVHGELELTLRLLTLSLSPTSNSVPGWIPSRSKTLLSDTFTNPDYLVYALRGCLTGSACYLLFNALQYPALSTSMITCVITALSSVGASRQKQVLRISGVILGGIVCGMGSQVLILPRLDSIVGFTLLFASVTAMAVWISSASSRLSYVGLQMALAYDLLNLQEFSEQTNLSIARDRVLGTALGLFAMWLIFDTFGSTPAVTVMQKHFAANLQLLAKYATVLEDDTEPQRTHAERLAASIAGNFDSVNDQADAVLFETGPSRTSSLALRQNILSWQPRLRSAFLILNGLIDLRTTSVSPDISSAVAAAQRDLEKATARSFLQLAARFESNSPSSEEGSLLLAYSSLQEAFKEEGKPADAKTVSVLTLSSALVDVLQSVNDEMALYGSGRPDTVELTAASPHLLRAG